MFKRPLIIFKIQVLGVELLRYLLIKWINFSLPNKNIIIIVWTNNNRKETK